VWLITGGGVVKGYDLMTSLAGGENLESCGVRGSSLPRPGVLSRILPFLRCCCV
jgi:hypothetical protein